jgi:hypothetical protein
VPVDLKTNDWNSLKEQFRALVHNEGVREDSLEQFVDDGIRRRFGEVISRACGEKGKQTFQLASENYYVELAQAQLLRRR